MVSRRPFLYSNVYIGSVITRTVFFAGLVIGGMRGRRGGTRAISIHAIGHGINAAIVRSYTPCIFCGSLRYKHGAL